MASPSLTPHPPNEIGRTENRDINAKINPIKIGETSDPVPKKRKIADTETKKWIIKDKKIDETTRVLSW